MTPESDAALRAELTIVLDGGLGDEARAMAEAALEALAAKAPRPVIFARFKLAVEDQRPAEQQAIAKATLDVSGALVRGEAAAPTIGEAIDRAGDRLDRRMRRLAERRQDARKRPPATPPGEWRRGDLPTDRPGYFPRPPEEREIIRHRTYAPREISIAEALFDLEVLDYRFLLFTDQSDDTTAVVYADDGETRLRRIDGTTPPLDRDLPIAVQEVPAPQLTVADAIARLDVSDEPFVLFRDGDDGEARVLYRRYDGHYGLIEPAA